MAFCRDHYSRIFGYSRNAMKSVFRFIIVSNESWGQDLISLHFSMFRHWLINLFATSQSDHCFYFIHPWGRDAGRTYLMDSPRIGQCLRREFPLLLHLLLIGQSCDG